MNSVLWKSHNVSAAYESQPVISNLNLEIFEGESFCIIGINGAGKSTLLKLLLGMLKASSGVVQWKGRPLSSLTSIERRESLSMMEAHPYCTFPMTVRELIEMSVFATGNSKIMARAIEITSVEPLLEKNILELSSGEVRRAFIAHLLAQNTKGILADELFTNLDWAYKLQLLKGLSEWKRDFGTTFVFAIHELDLVQNFADRIGLMHQGRMVKVGSPPDVLHSKEFQNSFGVDFRIINAGHN